MNRDLFEKYYEKIKVRVEYLASTYFVIGMSKEDLEQELYLHILKQIDKYDEGRNSIGKWINTVAFNRVYVLIKKTHNQKNNLGKKDLSLDYNYDEFTILDTIPAPEPEEHVGLAELFPLNDLLSKLELEVLDKYLNGGYNCKDKSMDCARTRIVNKLRAYAALLTR